MLLLLTSGSLLPFVFLLLSTLHVETTPLVPLTMPSNINISDHAAVCVTTPEWSIPTMVPGDCIRAAMRFQAQELRRYAGQSFEFVPHGMKPRSGLATQRTPKRYTYSKSHASINSHMFGGG